MIYGVWIALSIGDQKLKPKDILTKMISTINYLLLAWVVINVLIHIPPHIFTDQYIQHTTMQHNQIKSNQNCIDRFEIKETIPIFCEKGG